MAAIASFTLTLTVIGWLVAPIGSFLVNKLFSYLDSNLSRKLRELEIHIIPSLKLILGDITEQRVLRGAKDEGNGSEADLKTLGELDTDLKSALYDAEDVLDLIEYRRIEKKVIGGERKSIGTIFCIWLLQAVGDCISRCKRSSFCQKLWQCAQNQNQKARHLGAKLQQCALDLDLKFWDLVAKLQQYAQYLLLHRMCRDVALRATLEQYSQSLNMYIHSGAGQPQPSMPDAPAAEFRDDIEQGSATPSSMPDVAPSNPPSSNALPNSAGSEFRGGNQHGSAEEAPTTTLDALLNSLLQMIWDWLVYGFSALHSFYLAARLLRDRSYEPVGIKNDDDTTTDCVLSINEIISVRKRIKNIECTVSESKKSPLLNQNSSSFTIKNSAKESSSEKKEIDKLYRSIEKKVFGREDHCADISRKLREGSDTHVIVIYGITGSGKSTLAQYVCDYEKGAGHFDPIMFILVGKTFSVGDIFRDMLDQIKQQQVSGTKDHKNLKTELKDLDSLKAELKEKLKDKCLLLVLDDLWVNGNNMMERLILLDVLHVGESGSRILVTAQNKDAAAGLGSQQQFQIPDLGGEQYISMLMHYAHVSQITNTDFETYKAIGRKIMKKLHTSPIAGRTVAARLQSKNSIDEWKTIANDDVLNETMGALWWSYQQLGAAIRRCFAYCSTFPKGYKLEVDELVRIWIAQGFIHTRSNATEELEDVGQRYFDELLTFSFVQAERKDSSMIFRIHDLLHELAERVSGSEFYRIGLNGLPKDIQRGVHHLSIQTNNVAEIAEKILDMGNLRTLIINEDRYAQRVDTMERNHELEKVLGRLFMRLRKLRVLIIKLNPSRYEFSVPVSIYQMKHLRYLCFDFYVPRLILPSTLCKLYHIQVIDIPYSEASCPEDMTNLICLRHISGRLSCPNIGKLASLQTLTRFTVKEEQGYGLKQLMQLKLRGTLSIEGLEIVGSKEEALEAHLTDKEGLRTLKLDFGWDERYVQAEVLEGLCPPKDLQKLLILGYKGARYPSWMLSRQHPDTPKHLQKLELCSCSQLACIPEDSELFIGLRELNIFECNWDRLPENMDRLLSLQTLEILFCDNMELLPKLPVQSLKKIYITRCGVLSRTCKEEGHENWRKIKEIPEKEIIW